MKKLIMYALAAMLAMTFAGCHGRHHHRGRYHDVPPPVVHRGAHAQPVPAPIPPPVVHRGAHAQPVPAPIPPPIPPPVRPR